MVAAQPQALSSEQREATMDGSRERVRFYASASVGWVLDRVVPATIRSTYCNSSRVGNLRLQPKFRAMEP